MGGYIFNPAGPLKESWRILVHILQQEVPKLVHALFWCKPVNSTSCVRNLYPRYLQCIIHKYHHRNAVHVTWTQNHIPSIHFGIIFDIMSKSLSRHNPRCLILFHPRASSISLQWCIIMHQKQTSIWFTHCLTWTRQNNVYLNIGTNLCLDVVKQKTWCTTKLKSSNEPQ